MRVRGDITSLIGPCDMLDLVESSCYASDHHWMEGEGHGRRWRIPALSSLKLIVMIDFTLFKKIHYLFAGLLDIQTYFCAFEL